MELKEYITGCGVGAAVFADVASRLARRVHTLRSQKREEEMRNGKKISEYEGDDDVLVFFEFRYQLK